MLIGNPENITSSTKENVTSMEPERDFQVYGLLLLIIPAITILGNLLVITAVIRFKTLHSAINFLILELAVADLFVGLFVMPYAVYVYVRGGYWFLGNLVCDIYAASDVACSTASILLLTVISFDRYRAVSHPIHYSHHSQNIKRVWHISIIIWCISLAVASPMVLGVNYRPADSDPYECRFYNPEFSILSSIISFVIPCIIVLFVYMRIIIALHKREEAARLRQIPLSSRNSAKRTRDKSNQVKDATDFKLVFGPFTTFIALITRYMCINRQRQLDDKVDKKAWISLSPQSTSDTLSEKVAINSGSLCRKKKVQNDSQNSKGMAVRRPISIRSFLSSIHLLNKKENKFNIIANKGAYGADHIDDIDDPIFLEEILDSSSEHGNNRFSLSEADSPSTLRPPIYCQTSMGNSSPCPCSQAIIYRLALLKSMKFDGSSGNTTILLPRIPFADMYHRSGFQGERSTGPPQDLKSHKDSEESCIISNDSTASPFPMNKIQAEANSILNRSISDNSVLRTIRKRANDGSQSNCLLRAYKALISRNATSLATVGNSENNRTKTKLLLQNDNDICGNNKNKVQKRIESEREISVLVDEKSDSMSNIASRIIKKKVQSKERSERRKASKAQRKERKATKTLGIVVGIFLICWVPFFTINILNAVCIKLEQSFCQIGFVPFFYATWIGYVNSCLNPVIYTIFNTEFRRAFKTILSTNRLFNSKRGTINI